MTSAEISIRLATQNDLTEVQNCAVQAYTKYIDRMGQTPAPMLADFARQIDGNLIHIAHSGKRFTGYVVYSCEGDHLHLENVAVLPEFCGKGIGRRLIQHVEYSASELGLAGVELYTNEAMSENLAMYPKLGYVETHRQLQSGYSRVFFRKKIS